MVQNGKQFIFGESEGRPPEVDSKICPLVPESEPSLNAAHFFAGGETGFVFGVRPGVSLPREGRFKVGKKKHAKSKLKPFLPEAHKPRDELSFGDAGPQGSLRFHLIGARGAP